ncbi:MAG: hypothetical protein U5L08_00910 [Xanthomonadales bacterium]|nr:hypothetical protein [Xanthomonadales bacterium]
MTAWRHSRRSKTLLAISAVLVGGGLLSVAIYVFNALPVLGQPDESLVFWLLPFLLFGLTAAGVGTVFFVLWLLLVSTDREGADRH